MTKIEPWTQEELEERRSELRQSEPSSSRYGLTLKIRVGVLLAGVVGNDWTQQRYCKWKVLGFARSPKARRWNAAQDGPQNQIESNTAARKWAEQVSGKSKSRR